MQDPRTEMAPPPPAAPPAEGNPYTEASPPPPEHIDAPSGPSAGPQQHDGPNPERTEQDDLMEKIRKGTIILVIDKSATDPNRDRIHEVEVNGMVKRYVFKADVPRALPRFVAAKFLRHEGFIRVDENGDQIDWLAVPQQPTPETSRHFELLPGHTVANYKELTNEALTHRASLLPRGDVVINRPDTNRDSLIRFILETEEAKRRANESPEEADEDMFTPPPLPELEAI